MKNKLMISTSLPRLPQIVESQMQQLIKATSKYCNIDLVSAIKDVVMPKNPLGINNPNALKTFADIFCKHFRQYTNQNEVQAGCLIDNRFDFGSRTERFLINKAKKRFKSLMNGLDYIGFVTFSAYKNTYLNLDVGLLRSVHLHFILIGEQKIPRSKRKQIRELAICNDEACIPLKIVKYPLNQAVEYAWKSPIFMGYSSVYDPHKDKVSNLRSRPSLKQLYKYYQLFRGVDIDHWTIAGGKGKKIWHSIKKELLAIKEAE